MNQIATSSASSGIGEALIEETKVKKYYFDKELQDKADERKTELAQRKAVGALEREKLELARARLTLDERKQDSIDQILMRFSSKSLEELGSGKI